MLSWLEGTKPVPDVVSVRERGRGSCPSGDDVKSKKGVTTAVKEMVLIFGLGITKLASVILNNVPVCKLEEGGKTVMTCDPGNKAALRNIYTFPNDVEVIRRGSIGGFPEEVVGYRSVETSTRIGGEREEVWTGCGLDDFVSSLDNHAPSEAVFVGCRVKANRPAFKNVFVNPITPKTVIWVTPVK